MPSVDNSWSSTSLVPTQQQRYLWRFEYIYYSDGSVEVSDPVNLSIAGADADTTGVTEELDKTKQELTAKIEKAQNDSLAAVEEAKQELTNVADDLSQAKTDLQNAVSAVDTKATNLKNDLTQAKQDLASQAQQLQEQAGAQSELTNRVSSVEKTANGTKTTVSELSKTVAQNGKDITSVTARTKVVEDDLAGTKTTLSQVKTTADSTSQKTATLETGLNGLSAKFSNLKIGAVNLLHNSKGPFKPNANNVDNWQRFKNTYVYLENGKQYVLSGETDGNFTNIHDSSKETDNVVLWLVNPDTDVNKIMSDGKTGTTGTVFTWNRASGTYQLRVNTYRKVSTKSAWNIQIEEGNLRSTYSQNEADLEQKVAEYKQNADQNYASLQTTVQNLDGTVQHNKTVADQTAQGFSTRIESLETYKDGESERANAYFESAKTETAKQLTAERTAIAKDYVAKSTYTSDVTGIRNELSATTSTANTTKTNLANYQASNDRAVANLQSNIQTANGNISSLQTKIEAVPGQITSAVSAVEGKIPTEIGGVNLLRSSKGPFKPDRGVVDNYAYYDSSTVYLEKNQSYVISGLTDGEFSDIHEKTQESNRVVLWLTDKSNGINEIVSDSNTGTKGTRFTWANDTGTYCLRVNTYKKVADKSAWNIQVEKGNVKSDYAQSPLDTDADITKVSSEIQQTKDGITLLATKTELNSAKNELQSGINTATNKANNNAQTISTHTTQISALNTGLQAKVSQTDFNTLSGRVTTAENNITAKANELSSKITSVEGKIPTSVGTVNLVKGTGSAFVMGYGITNTTWNETKKQSILDFSAPGVDRAKSAEILPQENKFRDFKPIKGTTYTQSIMIDTDATFNPNGQMEFTWFANGQHNSQKGYIKKVGAYSYQVWSTYTWNLENTALRAFDLMNLHNVLGFRNSGTYLAFYKPKLTAGNLPSDWSPAPEDAINQISSLSSELKQTTDAIKASVSSLDSSTVKSSSLTINSDGIVMKAGKTTTDVANAIGSYFAVNQNAIDLFSDKINVKGSMIVDGAITGDKIKASSVDVSKIVGIDANFIKSKIEYAMIDWLKGKTITAYNDNMTIDLQDGRISFKDGSNAVYRQTPDGIHTGFLHFEAGSLGGIYAAFGATSTRQGINSKSSEFAGIRCYRVSKDGDSHDAKIDKIEVIGDTVQFGHGYRSDGTIGGGFIMDTAAYGNETPYSLNRVVKSIESLWRILHDHAKNTGYRFNDSAFINALNNEYNAWHDMHND